MSRFIILKTASLGGITISNCVFEQKSKNLDAITISTGALTASISDITIENCTFLGTAAGPDSGINILPMTSNITDIKVINCHFDYADSTGVDNACIEISVSNAATLTRLLIKDNTFFGLSDSNQFITVPAGSTGLVVGTRGSMADCTDFTIITNLLSYCDTAIAQPGTSSGTGKTNWPIASPAA